MGQATSMSVRQKIAYGNEQGISYLQLSKKYNVAYNTVKNLCKSYKKLGEAGLQTNYGNCGGKNKVRSSYFIYRCSIWLRRLHPSWGADTIRAKLVVRYPDKEVPSSRTLHRWFKDNGFIEKKELNH